MQMKALTAILIISFIFLTNISLAQKPSIYIPRNIVKAYEKETRSYDGKPGVNYWSNHSDYNIQAEVFPKERIVKGTEHIKYYNDSPKFLRKIVMRLYQDINKKGNSRDYSISPSDETDGVKIDTLIINGDGISTKEGPGFYRGATNIEISNLKKPIQPKSITTIDVNWSVIIPKETRRRMGAYNDSTLYVAYWYPQVAVFDDIDGWDVNDYGGEVEFYNDKNNFDFEITVPKNYLVWATGTYQNLKDVVKPEIYSRYLEAQKADSVIRIVRAEDLGMGTTSEKVKNTWKFKAEDVPDIAFGTSSGYVWDGVGAVIDTNGRKVFTDAAYPITSKGWNQVAYYAKLSVENLSKNSPGVPFPYPKITTFNGETKIIGMGGCEIPMMCNNGINSTKDGQTGLTLHEIAHTYFPFYMGTNERKYAWMDEGWATYFDSDLLGNIVKDPYGFTSDISWASKIMGDEFDTPMILPTIATLGKLEGFNSYTKAALSYYFLKDILGDELFKKALHEFINRWNGKHPIPWDYFFTFNEVAKEDLSWFWNPWYFERGFPDLSVKDVTVKRGKAEITVEKIGSVPVPVDLKIRFTDGTNEELHRSASIWKTGNKEVKIKLGTTKEIKKVELNTTLVPDADAKNNDFEVKKKLNKGVLLKTDKFATPDTSKFNFGFEKVAVNQKLPDKYFIWGKDYDLSTDSITKHNGKYSVLIQPSDSWKAGSFGCVAYKIPAIYEGKEIELRAYFKLKDVDDGLIGLLLRIDGASGLLEFDNMAKKNIQGTADWTSYSVTLPYPKDAKTIYIGAMLFGTGQVWVDDFELLIDGVDISRAKQIVIKQAE